VSEKDYIARKTNRSYRIFKQRRPLLNHLDIELTERCNNACMHCYINLPGNNLTAISHELTTQQWKGILQQAADLGALSVRFTGGEPLLREDFKEIYLHTRRLGIKVFLFTNARLITEDLVNLFLEVPLLKKIEVSSYGLHPQSYDSIACAPGAYNEFRHGVDLLLEKGIPFFVKSPLLPQNKSEMKEFESWVSTIPGMEQRLAYAIFLDLRTRRDSSHKNNLIRSLRLSPEEVVAILSRDAGKYRIEMAQFAAKFMHPTGNKLFNCGAGETGCVDAYGQYQMCMLLRHPDTVYDLTKGTIQEALTEFFPRVYELHAKNPDYLNRCANCFLRGLCEQCPAKSWSEHGTLDTPVEYYCQIAHAQARYLGLLAENEMSWEVSNWKDRVDAFVQKTLSEI